MLCAGRLPYLLLFAEDKPTLHGWRSEIIKFMESLRLTIHENSAQPRPCVSGIPFLGFTVFPDYRRLRSQKGYAFQRRLKGMLEEYHLGELPHPKFESRLQGWINHTRHGDTWGLRRAILKPFKV